MKRAYYLTGPDGSGKTTFLKEIELAFAAKGKKTTHIWVRSPKILSKPLMLYCRIVGLTKYKYIDGIKYGGHQFYKSKFVSFIFPLLQLIDFKIKFFIYRKQIQMSEIVLYDRFALDTLADLMVDTHRFDLHRKWIGKQFIKFLEDKMNIIVLQVDDEIIKSRKLDTKHDDNTAIKNKVYSILSKDLDLIEIYNNREIEIVKKEILKEFKIDERY